MVRKILFGLLILIIILLAGGYTYYRLFIYKPPLISNEDRQAIHLMPLPSKLQLYSGALDLTKGIRISYVNVSNDKIHKAVDRLISRVEQLTNEKWLHESGAEFRIDCRIDFSENIQQLNEDESYELQIKKDQIQLIANSPYGIFRGLETIYQLVEKNGNEVYLPFAEISDFPRFPWRGIMLDVCRHWMSKKVVLRTLDAMAAVKMNVFHWHLSDDQGFRVESKVFPQLHEVGSNGKYYTQEEIKEVIMYASARGIRIVPEFDLPGHSKSWQIAYPELSLVDFPLTFESKKGELFAPPLDPTNEKTYEFLDKFVGEMADLFPDPYFHIGGDEVNPDYWDRNMAIQAYMKEHGMLDHHDLQAYFNSRMHDILKKHSKKMIGWEEILHPDIVGDVVIQSWKGQKSLFEAVQEGGTGILSAGYYLDHKLHAGTYYNVDPLILPGAVDIIPDSLNWKMYDLTLEIPGGKMNSQLVTFDKDPQNVYGFFAIMDGRNAFKEGSLSEDGILKLNMISPMGELEFSAQLFPDSVNGKLSLGLLGFSAYGPKTGGSDMAGTQMPKIETIRPLTLDERARIIGGEACMWSEVVGPENVDSRIWPTTAAIAEKLWSPQALTTDSEDMYRRLMYISDELTDLGLTHEINYEVMLKELAGEDGYESLKTLVGVLEEVKYYGRLASLIGKEEIYLPDYPLDRVVDAAKPESLEARQFNLAVDKYFENPTDQNLLVTLKNKLEKWSKNNEELQPFIAKSEKLKDIENLSGTLAEVSNAALNKLNNNDTGFSQEQLSEKLNFLETGEHGVLVAVVPGLRIILLGN